MSKIIPGLVSVTFRKLSPGEIIELCKKAGVSTIEWGGDVHAKDEESAKKISELMDENEMRSVSLGSYYKAGTGQDFTPVLKTALALRTNNIRIWAGEKNSEDADDTYRAGVVRDSQNACDAAAKHDISISFEYHGNTLTNTQQSAVSLLDEINRANVYTYWQPLNNTDFDQNMKNIKELCDMNKLKNMHVYYWDGGTRLPLADGISKWKSYFNTAGDLSGAALLEFVIDDNQNNFINDAAALKEALS